MLRGFPDDQRPRLGLERIEIRYQIRPMINECPSRHYELHRRAMRGRRRASVWQGPCAKTLPLSMKTASLFRWPCASSKHSLKPALTRHDAERFAVGVHTQQFAFAQAVGAGPSLIISDSVDRTQQLQVGLVAWVHQHAGRSVRSCGYDQPSIRLNLKLRRCILGGSQHGGRIIRCATGNTQQQGQQG